MYVDATRDKTDKMLIYLFLHDPWMINAYVFCAAQSPANQFQGEICSNNSYWPAQRVTGGPVQLIEHHYYTNSPPLKAFVIYIIM